MSKQSWKELVWVQGAGPALTAAAEALLVTDVTVPAGYMDVGRVLHLHLVGKESSVVTTPGTMTFRVRWGGIAGTVLVASPAFTRNVIVQVDETWTLDVWVMCLTVGATGTFLTWGSMQRGACAAAVVADITPDILPKDTLAAVTVDTTTAKALSVTAQPSLADGSITCLAYKLTAEN